MQTIGLTGGIASGKSSVARILNRYPEIDADQVARRVVEPGSAGLQQVAAAFGPDILLADGNLNRAALRQRIAQDGEAQQRLNGILHPIIIAAIQARLRDLEQAGEEVAFVSAALMLESGSYRNYDAVVLVTAPEEIRLKRLLSRDGMEADLARKLMGRQWTDEKRRPYATVEIVNDGTLQDLEDRTRNALEVLQISWR